MTIPKIIYATIHPSDTKKSWSGLNYYIANALRFTGAEVITVSGFRCQKSFWLKLRFHLARLLGFNFYFDLTSSYGRQYAAQVDELLAADPDAVLFTVNSQLIPYLKSANKVVIYNDATYANLYGYYGYFSHLTPWDKRQCFHNERRAFQRADLLFFASDWAAQSAIGDFGAISSKVNVIPFGANLTSLQEEADVKQVIDQRALSPVRLLWVGVDFGRKGGALSVEVTRLLNETGTPATLTIAGIPNLTEMGFPAFVKDGGVFDKDTPAGEEGLKALYRNADFFILPSLLECYGVVFAEASAFGLPLLAIRTGGVPTIVQQGFNGWLFQPKDPAEKYVQVIMEMKNNLFAYREACNSARQAFEDKLNWQVAAAHFRALIWPGN